MAFPETTYAWLGGLIDGEGSVMLVRRTFSGLTQATTQTGGVKYRAVVSVSNTNRELLAVCAKRTGIDRIYEHRRPTARAAVNARSYTWRMSATEIREHGPRLLPWLTVKHDQMVLLLEALELKDRMDPNRPGGYEAMGREAITLNVCRIAEIATEIRHLNRKGPREDTP